MLLNLSNERLYFCILFILNDDIFMDFNFLMQFHILHHLAIFFQFLCILTIVFKSLDVYYNIYFFKFAFAYVLKE